MEFDRRTQSKISNNNIARALGVRAAALGPKIWQYLGERRCGKLPRKMLRADPFTFEVEKKISLLHLVDISCYKNLSLERVENFSRTGKARVS